MLQRWAQDLTVQAGYLSRLDHVAILEMLQIQALVLLFAKS